MQKRTRSILEELNDLYIERDSHMVLENRARNLLINSIKLLEQIDQQFESEQADVLKRRFLVALKTKNADKFSRSLRKAHGNL